MEYITPFNFATIFAINYRTVIKLIKDKKIKAIRVGSQYRIPRSEIDRMKSNSA